MLVDIVLVSNPCISGLSANSGPTKGGMTSRMKRTWMIMISIVTVLIILWAVSYHPSQFKGGVAISDSGFFSYPRYHAQLGDLPLWKQGEYQFTVHGLPPGPLDLKLLVLGSTGANTSELTSLTTNVGVSIIDSSGKRVCEANGNLSDAGTAEHSTWALASSSSQASFWHPRCLQVPASRFKTYVVSVRTSAVDPRSPHNMVRLVLEGGGIELP